METLWKEKSWKCVTKQLAKKPNKLPQIAILSLVYMLLLCDVSINGWLYNVNLNVDLNV